MRRSEAERLARQTPAVECEPIPQAEIDATLEAVRLMVGGLGYTDLVRWLSRRESAEAALKDAQEFEDSPAT